MTDEEIVELWKTSIVAHGAKLDEDNDKGGHDWHSLWAGFVIALGRADLSGWDEYMNLGFPCEGGAT